MRECIFDEVINRKNTDSLKWDYCKHRFGREDILPMWVADMDFKSPDLIIEAIMERVRHGVFGYTEASERLSSALVGWMKNRHNWQINSNWIVYSPGVVTSINTAILAYTRPGDKVLIQTPVYYPFYFCVRENERELVTNPLKDNNGHFEIDFDDLERKLADNVKMMIFCSPHNPIGRVWSLHELEEVLRLCKKYDVFIVSDEIHSDLVFKGYKHIPISSLAGEDYKKCITLNSPTKTFNIAGLSISSAIIPDAELKRIFIRTLNKNGANMLNIFGLTAAEAAYAGCGEWLDELLVYLENNLDTLVEYFQTNIPRIKVIRPEATYLAWLDCRNLPVKAEKLKEFFVHEAGVGMNDGITFGVEGAGFQRLNFACPKKILLEGLGKIKNAVDRL
ncbi:MalY/PatB family protein [Acetivibrio clariflavus]|uniref:cysteine-S-conjugate beta-lyase n=1 Tax=Acetivibrio clariflavus (strain DSM 19732 / NBRC 101661 / EBR45) TaxID=720554 RepID=G8M2C8_ACECE|nr:PatB family C-S lyase [Acetivibrio clariflavus]AEV69287.1 bifunctional PLP-dependent enzyme with beta-cystathionase and maltose regulon repressor activities [Acetivibrio clariflavus DSM 19732]HPU42033.1 PatB family C-S lyase [Acetivibrio clariflavus]